MLTFPSTSDSVQNKAHNQKKRTFRNVFLHEACENCVHIKLCNVNLLNVTTSLISQNPREWNVLSLKLTPCYHAPFPYIMSLFWHKYKPPKNVTHTHTHHIVIIDYHYCNVDFMLFHIVTHYTSYLYHASMLTLYNSLISQVWYYGV